MLILGGGAVLFVVGVRLWKFAVVIALGRLPLDEPARARDQLAALEEIGVAQLIHGDRYPDADAFRSMTDRLGEVLPR